MFPVVPSQLVLYLFVRKKRLRYTKLYRFRLHDMVLNRRHLVMEDYRMRLLENVVLRKMLGPN